MTEKRVLNGRYELGELLGRGGMADVHRGTDTLLGRTVAVKLLRPDLARDPQFQARFKREAQAVASLNHSSIVAIYDTGEYAVDGGHGETVQVPYIVMEFVAGRTLREYIRNKELDIDRAIELCLGVLSALEYSHKAGIVHRDIKPGNVMVCEDDTVKVMDFGIARAMADSAATMTQTQAVVGTAQYLSPEQARGETVDARSDLYSAACLLFEMLTSRPPFTGDSPVSLAYQHVREMPEAASNFNPEVSEALDSVLAKGLQKERADRFQDAAAFRRALRAARNGIAVPAGSEASTEPNELAPVAAAEPAPETLVGFTGIGFLDVQAPARSQEVEEPLPARYEGEYEDDDALPLGLPPERERSKRQKSRRRAWTAVVVLFTVLILAGGGIWLYYLMNQKPEAPKMVPIPSVANMSDAAATTLLYEAGLTPVRQEVTDNKIPEGSAIGTDPSAGTEMAEGSQITLKISIGPSSVTVPKDLVGQTEATARDLLSQARLSGGKITRANHPAIPAGSVISSTPAPGAVVAPNSKVDLVISTGKVEMPKLIGLLRAEAEKALTDLKLTVKVVEQENSQRPPGEVTAQSSAAQTLVEQGSEITITVAKAPAPKPDPTPPPTPSEEPSTEPTKGKGKQEGLGDITVPGIGG